MDTAPPPRPRLTGPTLFVLTILVGVTVAGGVFFVTNHPSPAQTTAPGPYSTETNQTGTQTGTAPPSERGVPPLPPSLLGNAPEIVAEYDNMPFAGEQGPYCWAGNATTVQAGTTAALGCHSAASPTEMSGLPTIAVYPNATLGFQFPEDIYVGFGGASFVSMTGLTLAASLFQSGSMSLVASNPSSISGFALGILPAGDYILKVNATWGHSYTVDYFGIQQIESVNFTEGSISISIGSPSVRMTSLTQPAGGSAPSSQGQTTVSGPDLETWPLTLTSPTVVRSVNLSSISVIRGDWVRFLPSFLPEVGPNGTEADMLLSGAVRPFVNNDISNVTMIIQASASGGSVGEVGLPLEGAGGAVVFHSLASGQDFETPTWGLSAADQTNFGGVSLIYDPPSPPANQSLPVVVSIAGLYEAGGAIVPLPSWLQFTVPQSSTNLSIAPYQPLEFAIGDYTATSAPLGGYTLVIEVQVGSASMTLFAPVEVGAPISMGGPAG